MLQSCELLSFSLSLTSFTQLIVPSELLFTVVNCFHFHYLWPASHNADTAELKSQLLWIAFIFIIFDQLHTTLLRNSYEFSSCELLSFSLSLTSFTQLGGKQEHLRRVVNCFHFHYLWPASHNEWMVNLSAFSVVNCFHFHYLWPASHNGLPQVDGGRLLWIAFIFIIFDQLHTTDRINAK